ncbi:hypothetical protein CEXT_515171 [Caerostris extrusa]|uniref:Uncharacterized protein n=1 Tax=Caerostris extrusa TaxID=172846 RepID=A0AAV4MP80_CAEEX|nr:hypothetical protein CEXT_515171 [Caerostris extrusa]
MMLMCFENHRKRRKQSKTPAKRSVAVSVRRVLKQCGQPLSVAPLGGPPSRLHCWLSAARMLKLRLRGRFKHHPIRSCSVFEGKDGYP